MEIKVLGSGCSKCRSTIGIIERAAQALDVDVEIVKVENLDEIKRAGVRATPAVMIDGNHRTEAALLAGCRFSIIVFTIDGPLDPHILPDLKHWQR